MTSTKKNRPHAADYSAGVAKPELDVPPSDSNGKTCGDRFGGRASVVEQSIAPTEVDQVHHQYLATAKEAGKLSNASNLTALAETLESALSTVKTDQDYYEQAPRVNAVDMSLTNVWITKDSKTLAAQDFGKNLQECKNFNAKRKFKGSVNAVIASNKMTSLGENFRQVL
eukprot:CAMPEP_0202484994 /NCGR_PEP_ID=MMETSP1361-20130828/3930_1 /ASSEMBLY_ACC=CAM_ASM_000849 /TAXON_ID=210615 /ORGANISM="Staurosira complex sp., Strain CCMP2646" /LENGTH=169 /DNA_ID=CAMNT_0049113779 /DNA_START=132 /DNA_END=641 /DNA_ORIENTATION=-